MDAGTEADREVRMLAWINGMRQYQGGYSDGYADGERDAVESLKEMYVRGSLTLEAFEARLTVEFERAARRG